MLQQAEVLRDESINYEGRQGVYSKQWKTWWLTGWMLSAVGLMEMPVGDMPIRGAPTLMPVAPMLMPAGEVFTKQGLYEKTEPPPDTCAARQTHHATCQARIADTLLHSALRTLLPLTTTQDLLDSRQPYSPAEQATPLQKFTEVMATALTSCTGREGALGWV